MSAKKTLDDKLADANEIIRQRNAELLALRPPVAQRQWISGRAENN